MGVLLSHALLALENLIRAAAPTNHAEVPPLAPHMRNPSFLPSNGFLTRSENVLLTESLVLHEFKLTAA